MKLPLAVFSLVLATTAVAAEVPIAVPAEPNTQFFRIEKDGNGSQQDMVVKHIGPGGISFSQRRYECVDNTVKQLASGSSVTGLAESRPETVARPIKEGSIDAYLAMEACK